MEATRLKRTIRGLMAGLAWAVVMLAEFGCSSPEPGVRLFTWERGVGLESREHPGMTMYLWFYEWNMFDAVQEGQHTGGQFEQFESKVNADENRATLMSDNMRLDVEAVADGAELLLTITNRSEHDWPELAGIIPCFNPGPKQKRNDQFANTNTYFAGPTGLLRQQAREIHFNAAFRRAIDAESDADTFVFSHKWPTSETDATAGVLIRESTSGEWVTGIAWESFLAAQGHNPWQCMHLCIRVGPLKRGETRTVRGKVYLLRGDRTECFRRYCDDFEHP